jgi:ribonuclease BN (tRNA processing enzyme)
MGNFEVIALGVGDTFSEKHHSTALLLACDGFHLAIDCPDMYRSVLRDAGEKSGRTLDLAKIDHVLITHVHGDHMNGLEGVAFYRHFALGKKTRLLTLPEVRETIWDKRLEASMGTLWDGARFRNMSFDSYFEHIALREDADLAIGPFRIRARKTIHHVPTSALFIEAEGRTLGYSSDTAFDPELIRFLEPADLIIHETNLGPAHTRYSALAALPAELRSKMRLIHYSDGFETVASEIAIVREGEILEV